MKRVFCAGAVPLVIALMLALVTTPVRADDTAKLRELFEMTESRAHLESYPDEILGGLGELPEEAMGDLRRSDLEALARRHFDPAELEADILNRMSGKITGEHLEAVIAFYRTDLGRRLVAMEVAAASVEATLDIETEGARLHAELAESDPERVETFRRITDSIPVEDMMMAMMMNMTYALISGMSGSPALPRALSDDEIIALVNAQAQQFRPMVGEYLKAYFAYTYRDATNDDLDLYADFVETDAGRAYNTVTIRAMADAIVNRMRAFGHGLMVLRGVRKT